MKKVKYDKDGWPEVIPYLDKDDFIHESWMNKIGEDERKALGLCGNRRCMVGWVGSVFYQNSLIVEMREPLSKGCREFLKRLAEFSGKPFTQERVIVDDFDREPLDDFDQESLDYELMLHVSDTFEGGCPEEDDDRTPMSADLAAQIWGKAMRSFGYTKDVFIEYIDNEDD